MASAIGHVAMQTRVQDWTHVHILTDPVATGHWTQAGPINLYHSIFFFFERDLYHSINMIIF